MIETIIVILIVGTSAVLIGGSFYRSTIGKKTIAAVVMPARYQISAKRK